MKKSDLKKLPKVGKGGFTRCYKLDEDTVLLESFDPIKKVMAEGKFPPSKLFPEVRTYENPFGVGGDFYTMFYFKGRPNRSTQKWLKDNLKPFHFETFLTLHELRKNVESSISGKRNVNRQEVWNKAFSELENKNLARILIEANDACCEVADNIMFDCAPKNVATHDGNLILLDCFYSAKEFYKMKFSDKPEWALSWE